MSWGWPRTRSNEPSNAKRSDNSAISQKKVPDKVFNAQITAYWVYRAVRGSHLLQFKGDCHIEYELSWKSSEAPRLTEPPLFISRLYLKKRIIRVFKNQERRERPLPRSSTWSRKTGKMHYFKRTIIRDSFILKGIFIPEPFPGAGILGINPGKATLERS